MRLRTLAIPVALLSLLTACSTSSEPVDRLVATPTTAAEPAPAEPAPATTAAGGTPAAGAAVVLNGALGANDAFTIELKDDKGAPVTTLKAGTYQMKIDDTSKLHNFHLSGPGVDETTTIPEVKKTTWPVKLTAGTYTFECDPHSNMKKTFTVT